MKKYVFAEIDMRNDFADDPRAVLPVPGTYAIVGKMAVLEKNASSIIIAADTHELDDPVSKDEFKSFPPHCVPGTWGWNRIPGLTRFEEGDLRITKNSYDTWKGMIGEGVEAPVAKLIMRKFKNVDTIVVGGIVTGICVKAFMDGAIERGLSRAKKLIVITDCVANLDIDGVPKTEDLFNEWDTAGAKLMTYEEFVNEYFTPFPRRTE